jgi:hypothetical protein
MPPLLLELWREQHSLGPEQTARNFEAYAPVAKMVHLFGQRARYEAAQTQPENGFLDYS